MSTSDSEAVIIQKVNDTIESCKNEEHLKCAYSMLRNVFHKVGHRKYSVLMQTFHIKRAGLSVSFMTYDGWVAEALYENSIKRKGRNPYENF
jgi:hypothetical protein